MGATLNLPLGWSVPKKRVEKGFAHAKTNRSIEVGLLPWKINQLSPPAGEGLDVVVKLVHPVILTVPGSPVTTGVVPVAILNFITVPAVIADVTVHAIEPSTDVLEEEVEPKALDHSHSQWF